GGSLGVSRRNPRYICRGGAMTFRESDGKSTQASPKQDKRQRARPSKRFRRRDLLIGGVVFTAVAGILALLFPLRGAFAELIAGPVLAVLHEVMRWMVDRSQLAVWSVATGIAFLVALLAVRPRLSAWRILLHPRKHQGQACSDREILIHAIHSGHRHVLYRVIVARQMTRLALQLIRQRERCSHEAAATKLRQGTWPAPDSVKAFLEQRLPAARGLRVSEEVYAAQLSGTVGFLESYAEGKEEGEST
nr:hypothetical protein [Candidatus Bipolaricaulota bacterium]